MSNIPVQLMIKEYEEGHLRGYDVGLALKVWFDVTTEEEYYTLFSTTSQNIVKRAILHVIGDILIDDPIPFLADGFNDSAVLVRIAAIHAAVIYTPAYPNILTQMWAFYNDPGEPAVIRDALRTALERVTGEAVPKWTA